MLGYASRGCSYRELATKYVVHNVERGLTTPHEWSDRPRLFESQAAVDYPLGWLVVSHVAPVTTAVWLSTVLVAVAVLLATATR